MAWCYYCRRYTVNGQCPNCGRIYETPGKKYDFYGKEIKENNPPKKKSSSSSSSSYSSSRSSGYYYSDNEGSAAGGFFLALLISFFAIIIASAQDKREMKKGAIAGTIVWGVIVLHVITIFWATFSNAFGGDWEVFKEWFLNWINSIKQAFGWK